MKVGELTEPMVNIISQVAANCLDPGGNINKDRSHPSDKTWNSTIHSLLSNQILMIT